MPGSGTNGGKRNRCIFTETCTISEMNTSLKIVLNLIKYIVDVYEELY